MIIKNLIFFFYLFLGFMSLSQKETKIHLGVTEKIGSVFGKIPFYQSDGMKRLPYSEMSIQVGMEKPICSGALTVSANYQVYGNLKNKDVSAFYHKDIFLGLNLKYRFSNRKKFRPFVGIGGFTQISDNYRNKSINGNNLNPSENPVFLNARFNYINTYNPFGGNPNLIAYTYSSFYLATPFVGNLSFGYEMYVTKGLFINLAVVSSIRFVQTKTIWFDGYFIEEGFDESTVDELLTNEPIEMTLLNDIGFRLGLSYVISLKKSKKIN